MTVKRVIRNVVMGSISLFMLTGAVVMVTVQFEPQAAVFFLVTGLMLMPLGKRKRKSDAEKAQYYQKFNEGRRPVNVAVNSAQAMPVEKVSA